LGQPLLPQEELEGAQVIEERSASILDVLLHVRIAQLAQAFRAYILNILRQRCLE
jgi:hypothetical protein